jgi:mono/diheme cytochrome c family protein
MVDVMANVLAIVIGVVANAGEVRSAPDSVRIQAGRAIYQQACASCHGAQGEGAPRWEGPDPSGELPAPPHDSKGHTWRHSDAMLYRLVQQGWRDPFNKSKRLTMPAFKGQLSREETIAVVAYLKTLWTPEQRRFQAEESRRQPFPAETQ